MVPGMARLFRGGTGLDVMTLKTSQVVDGRNEWIQMGRADARHCQTHFKLYGLPGPIPLPTTYACAARSPPRIPGWPDCWQGGATMAASTNSRARGCCAVPSHSMSARLAWPTTAPAMLPATR